MKLTKVKFASLILGLICAISVIALSIMFIQNNAFASASTADNTLTDEAGATVKYFKSDSRTIVEATYSFVRLSESECSVKIANKAEATVAILPKKGEISGKEYTVTEIAANGFASSPKLERVCLSPNIKKINNSAFSNCAELKLVDLHKVETIGNNVFYKCPKLSDIRIPVTVTSVGSNVFRNNTTYVHIVDDESYAEENWTATWNSNNNCTEGVDYETKYLDPVPLDEVYSEISRSADQELIGYAYAAGQPVNFSNKKIQTYSDGEIDEDNVDDYKDAYDNVIIPAKCEEDGKPILKIAGNAFEYTPFNKCIIEYYDQPIEIASGAFYYANGKEVIINRDVNFSSDLEEHTEIFSNSQIESIVLPDSLTCLPESAFAYCPNLTNIFFKTPNGNLSQDYLLGNGEKNYINDLINSNGEGKVILPKNSDFTTIGVSALQGTTSISELHIYDNVLNIGASAVSEWTNGQKVHVHNKQKVPTYDYETHTGWDDAWFDNSCEIKYDYEGYTITLDLNGGKLPAEYSDKVQVITKDDTTYATIDVVKDKPIEDLFDPIKDGCNFDGWLGKDGKYYSNDDIYTHNSDLIITAQWKDKEYVTIIFYLNNGTPETYPVKIERGQKMPVLEDYKDKEEYQEALKIPTYTGYNFKGYEDRENILYYDSEMKSDKKCEIEGDVLALSAIWEEKTTKIHYELNGGDRNGNPDTVKYFTHITLKDAYYKHDTFLGWYYNNEKIEELTNREEEEMTLVAKWEASHITLEKGCQSISVSAFTYGSFVIISVPNLMEGCTVNILPGVNKVCFVSRGLYHSMSIKLQAGTHLILDNISIVGFNYNYGTAKQPAYRRNSPIEGSGIDLETFETVNLYGAAGVKMPAKMGDEFNMTNPTYCTAGLSAINCKSITINNHGFLKIYGGTGGNGCVGNDIFMRGKECDGGTGGFAISANTIDITSVGFSIYIVGGDGGNSPANTTPGKGANAYTGTISFSTTENVFIAKGSDGHIA